MSRHRYVASAHWSCPVCLLSTEPAFGPSAAQETAHLAAVHDRLHHGGGRTAQVLLADPLAAQPRRRLLIGSAPVAS